MYKKPVILTNNDLAEGVYAASGSVSSGSSTYTLKQTNAWDGNKQYDITFTNNADHKLSCVTVEMKVRGTVTSIGGNVSGIVNGSTASITFNNYCNGIEANTTVGPIYMAVTGS